MKHLSDSDVLLTLRSKVKEMGGQRAVSKQIGVSEQTISDALHTGRLQPRLLRGLGFRKVISYEKVAA